MSPVNNIKEKGSRLASLCEDDAAELIANWLFDIVKREADRRRNTTIEVEENTTN